MVIKILVLAGCLALATAQTPTRPVFAETFYASGEVELHVAQETRMGKCKTKCSVCRAGAWPVEIYKYYLSMGYSSK